MGKTAIKIEGLGKRYRIGRIDGYKTIRGDIIKAITNPLRRLRGTAEDAKTIFWALSDVGFDIEHGEVIGIIGRNGAGKSTLLKVLSRITEPTTGRVEVNGRVGSLLEVGTGFHPELTGRENIYLNGAILGMKQREIAKKFDEIIAFAETEKFLDTPVKHYSSGMYMRLAFAVAAHLEPEILVVDEVLAVGDAAFQRKCFGKMDEVSKQGRTILFVSHNMGAITHLTRRAVHLDGGKVKAIGPSAEVVSEYLRSTADQKTSSAELPPKNSDAYFTSVRTMFVDGLRTSNLPVTEPFNIELNYIVKRPIAGMEVSFSVINQHGQRLFYSGMSRAKKYSMDHEAGEYTAHVHFPGLLLAPGYFTIRCSLHQPNMQLFDQREDVIGFQIIESGSDEYGYHGADIGSILVRLDWTLEKRDQLQPA